MNLYCLFIWANRVFSCNFSQDAAMFEVLGLKGLLDQLGWFPQQIHGNQTGFTYDLIGVLLSQVDSGHQDGVMIFCFGFWLSSTFHCFECGMTLTRRRSYEQIAGLFMSISEQIGADWIWGWSISIRKRSQRILIQSIEIVFFSYLDWYKSVSVYLYV